MAFSNVEGAGYSVFVQWGRMGVNALERSIREVHLIREWGGETLGLLRWCSAHPFGYLDTDGCGGVQCVRTEYTSIHPSLIPFQVLHPFPGFPLARNDVIAPSARRTAIGGKRQEMLLSAGKAPGHSCRVQHAGFGQKISSE